MFSTEEKTVILGSLFHDIGKFEQRCNIKNDLHHDLLGARLIDSEKFKKYFEKILGSKNFPHFVEIISKHHTDESEGLLKIVQTADQLSSGNGTLNEKKYENPKEVKGIHLASPFTKIKLKSDQNIPPRFYKHKNLGEKEHDIVIPKEVLQNELPQKHYGYGETEFNSFKDELENVLSLYENEEDFGSIINMILLLFEKWTWCIPDFNGEKVLDVSLYNHLKDTAAISHAIYLTQKENEESSNLNLIIGDLPGIQKYIFDVANKKPAKVLRGRSIFVQILTKNFATLFIKEFGLTEASLIMLAGGKFYLIAPDTKDFDQKINSVQKKIEDYLFENFRMELSFNFASFQFDYIDLLKKKKTFGQIIEEASFKLLQNRYLLFNNRLFENGSVEYSSYILKERYIDDDGSGTDSIKCKVTGKPIRIEEDGSRLVSVSEEDEEGLRVDLQVSNEIEIGSRVTGNNLIVIVEKDGLTINPRKIRKAKNITNVDVLSDQKLIINPKLDVLFLRSTIEKLTRNFYLNMSTLEVANYCSFKENTNSVLPFEDIVEEQKGAKYLTLIKGDIDNLGLIMAYGLNGNSDEEEGISRTTTLSSHLKYYFSFFINGFLQKWEEEGLLAAKTNNQKVKESNNSEVPSRVINDRKVYTVFAGGDDLMLITTQQSALKLVNEFNKKFSEFICSNEEVHISYSFTNFKDHSPIRIIADIAKEEQKRGKKYEKNGQYKMLLAGKKDSFIGDNDKASSRIFGTNVKNRDVDSLIKHVNDLTQWVNENEISHGILQRLLDLSEMEKKYRETNDAGYLITYARMAYSKNRLKKMKPEISSFLEKVIKINTEKDIEAGKIKSFLYPLICQVIYNTRKS